MPGVSVPPGSPLWLVILGGFVALIGVGVGAYRKWRSGEIEDDGVLLDRVNADNVNLRELNKALNLAFDAERKLRLHAELSDAIHVRQLIRNNYEPEEVPND